MANTVKLGESAEDTELGERLIEGLGEALALRRGEISLPVRIAEDDAPDLSTPDYQAKLAAVTPRRGRPKAGSPKISTTIRLDADILQAFRAAGPGWQSRINDALRKAMEKGAA